MITLIKYSTLVKKVPKATFFNSPSSDFGMVLLRTNFKCFRNKIKGSNEIKPIVLLLKIKKLTHDKKPIMKSNAWYFLAFSHSVATFRSKSEVSILINEYFTKSLRLFTK